MASAHVCPTCGNHLVWNRAPYRHRYSCPLNSPYSGCGYVEPVRGKHPLEPGPDIVPTPVSGRTGRAEHVSIPAMERYEKWDKNHMIIVLSDGTHRAITLVDFNRIQAANPDYWFIRVHAVNHGVVL